MTPGRVVTCTLTEAGAALARRLPYEHQPGRLVATVRERWSEVDGFVLIGATGIAVRAIAPLLADKAADPAVVVVDDAGRFAIALSGGHRGGANVLAREVAALLGAEPVVTTATDTAGLPSLDTLPGFTATGDLAAVTRSWLDGTPPTFLVDETLAAWPLPELLRAAGDSARPADSVEVEPPDPRGTPGESAESSDVTAGQPRTQPPFTRNSLGDSAGASDVDGWPKVLLTDRDLVPGAGEVLLRPRSLVLGVGSSSGADPTALHRLVFETLAGAGLSLEAVGCVATVDRKADEPAIVELATALGVALRTFPAEVLAAVPVPNPSDVVEAAVGTPSVAEAAALAAAGGGRAGGGAATGARRGRSALVVEKTRSAEATVAVARRVQPEGHLAVVGLGPGDPSLRTPAAAAAVRHADVVIGYGPYVDMAEDLLAARQTVVRSPIGAEAERVTEALDRAAGGEQVVLVCSGDPGVYAMASLVCQLAPQHGEPPVTVVPGVTAALAAAAVLGAPLGHDHAAVSLSDLLTPWPVIERRLRAVAEGDFTVSLYNPRSKRRATQLDTALEILAARRPPGTPAAIVSDVGRPAQRVIRTTLEDLDREQVGMLSLVVVGSSTTRWMGDRMVTPRGYLDQDVRTEDAAGPAPSIHPIEEQSYRIMAGTIDLSGWPEGARDVVARMVHSTADESFAATALIGDEAVEAAVAALAAGAPVVCDARMVVAGIPGVGNAVCFLDDVPQAPPGDTRSAAAIRLAARRHPDGALWVIGNAPTALVALLDLHAAGLVRPAAVVGLPVGYVGAAESKAALWAGALRSRAITNTGGRGGSAVAAGAVNALSRLAAARRAST